MSMKRAMFPASGGGNKLVMQSYSSVTVGTYQIQHVEQPSMLIMMDQCQRRHASATT